LTSTEIRPPSVLSEECKEVVANAVRHILAAVGEDVERDGLQRTPERVARMYDELLEGYLTDPEELLNNALFDVEYDQMVVVKDIEFYSVRTPHDPLLWLRPRGLPAYGQSDRPIEDPAPRRNVRPEAPGPGANDTSGRRVSW